MKIKNKKIKKSIEKQVIVPERRLSFWRVLLFLLIWGVIGYGGFLGYQWWKSTQVVGADNPWFAAYVDVTATPEYAFQNMGSTAQKDAILSFIVSSPTSACTPSWGGDYTLNQAGTNLNLDNRIARLQQQGGSIAISFGGQANQELAVGCTNPTDLLNAYSSVVSRYNINTIDLDIEGSDLSNSQATVRRADAIAKLQEERRKAGKKLAVWLTLPVTPQGLTSDGTNEVSTFLSKGVDLSGVNVMTMDYGSSMTKGENMLSASESALVQTQRQLGILYQRAGIYLNNATLWRKIGATPMIGQNNFTNEVFTTSDATMLNSFAVSHGIGRMSMWSANRDLQCGSNYVYTQVVSTSCSGVSQSSGEYANILSQNFDGTITLSAGFVTVADKKPIITPDNPATSPYQIWSPTSSYLEGTKVVWHHNIYEAKWWTQGNVPDDPVLQSWQTPWELIGPVLPGEKPIPQPTLPAGTYPNWTGTAVYNTGDRVLFNGVPYQAKWWNQGDSPAAAASNPDGSPWVPLTQAQVNAVISSLNSSK